jgi:hypothetical protein
MVNYSKAYWKRVSDRNRICGKRSAAVQREARLTQTIDADTLRQRALHDRRGTFYAEIVRATEAGFTRIHVYWSVSGRVDQLDGFYNGEKVFTCRESLVLESINEFLHAEAP